jgi:hypothetical protein
MRRSRGQLQKSGTHPSKTSLVALRRFEFCVGICVQIRLIRKLAECLDGVDVSQYQAGDVLDLPSRDAEVLLAEGWASRSVEATDELSPSTTAVEEFRSVPEEPKRRSQRRYQRRTEDHVREEFRESWATPVRANPRTRRDDVHSACDAVQRIVRKQDPQAAQQQLRLAAATMSRRGASKGGQARAAKLSAKERSEIAKRAAAARWSKPR